MPENNDTHLPAPVFRGGKSNSEKAPIPVHDHTTLAREISTVVHEVGHLYGAPDHYNGAPNGWTIAQLNGLDVVAGQQLFSDTCIYGNKETASVVNNLTVCAGCTKVIRDEIELPDKPPTTSS